MSSVGKFLLGGIQFQKNFIGKQTIQTGFYTLVECTVKVSPLLIMGLAHGNSQAKTQFLLADKAVEGKVVAAVKRSSFE